jgi:hypothetical protein
MRIVSLVPHATELLFELGLGPEVVGVTHECDHPPAALALTQVTRDVLPGGLSAAEIDAAVRERTLAGEAIYALDRDALAALEPDLIVTQALCPVCAVSYEEVADFAKALPSPPSVIALDPKTLGETFGDVRTLAQATERRDSGRGSDAAGGGADRSRQVGRARAASPARGGPGVARPGVRGRPLDAAADRAGRRRGRAGAARGTIHDRQLGDGGGGRTGGRGGDAVWLRRAAVAGGGDAARPRAGRAGRAEDRGGGRIGVLLQARARG